MITFLMTCYLMETLRPLEGRLQMVPRPQGLQELAKLLAIKQVVPQLLFREQ